MQQFFFQVSFYQPPFHLCELCIQELIEERRSEVTNCATDEVLSRRKILESLGHEPGMLGVIFRKSQSKIQSPAKLCRLVELINGETWLGLDVDVKGAIYEGLLEKNAKDVKGRD